jgi:hypothetical protein
LSYDIPVFLEKKHIVKKKISCFATGFCWLAAMQLSQAGLVTNISDIQNWTGTGSQNAALVFQWNDGQSPAALVWGYRWNGSATGYDMLTAIAGITKIYDANDPSTLLSITYGADDRISLDFLDYSWGTALNAVNFNTGATLRTQSDWSSGYWEYFNVGGSFLTPPDGDPNLYPGTNNYPGDDLDSDWVSSYSGLDTRVLSDGSWDAWSFAAAFNSVPVVQGFAASADSSAVPEPGQVASSVLLIIGLGFYLWRRRRALAKAE